MKIRSFHQVSLLALFAILTGCAMAPSHPAGMDEAAVWRNLFQTYLAENRLVHLNVSPPKGWLLGPGSDLQALTDFPYSSETRTDFALFQHPASRSFMFLSFKPILGQSYFGGTREKFLAYFQKAQIKNYQRYQATVEESSVRSFPEDVGGRVFSVIRYDYLTSAKEKRAIRMYLSVDENLYAISIFGFSSPWQTGLEQSRPFQEFLSVVSGSRFRKLDPYEEVLYRDLLKDWIPDPNNPMLHNAALDESIGALKEAVRRNPEKWEARYLLASNYASSYWPIPREGEDPEKPHTRGYPLPIDPQAAVAEFDSVLKMNPDFSKASPWLKLRYSLPPTSASIRDARARAANATSDLDRFLASLEEEVRKTTTNQAKRSSLQMALEDGYRSRADLHSRQGNPEAAIEDYRRALAISGDDRDRFELESKIAEEYVKTGKKLEALNTYKDILETLKKTDWSSTHLDAVRARIRELQE